jgi:hypothetical protein
MEQYSIEDIREYYSETKLGQGTVLWTDKHGRGIIIMYHVNLPIEVYFDSSAFDGDFDSIRRHDLLRFKVTYRENGYFAKEVRK